MNKMKIIRYSEAFKLEVIRQYEEGKMTQKEICRHYGINGAETLNNWLRKYGKSNLLNRIIRVEKPNEKSRLNALEAENKKLKEALASSYIKQITAESSLEVAAEIMGLTVEELKKKLGEK